MFFKIIEFLSCIGYRKFSEENVDGWIKKYKKESGSCQGFYVDFISQRTGEYELLLKRNTKFKKIGYINQNDRMLILCKAECN